MRLNEVGLNFFLWTYIDCHNTGFQSIVIVEPAEVGKPLVLVLQLQYFENLFRILGHYL